MKTAYLFLLLNLLFCANNAVAVVKAKVRRDLGKKLTQAVCNNQFPTHPLDVWKLGIYDAQMLGKSFTPYRSSEVSEEFLRLQANRHATKFKHNGQVYGKCPDGTGWLASMPALTSLYRFDGDIFQVNRSALDSVCEKYWIDFAPAEAKPTQRLTPKKLTNGVLRIHTKDLPDGTLAVTCEPRQPTWLGSTLWHLAPVKQGPGPKVPFAEELYSTRDPNADFHNWVNKLRASVGSTPLKRGDKMLKLAASKLAKSNTILHNRHLNQRVAQSLQRSGYTWLGENRAKGKSNFEIAWLLWNSPRHRQQILAPEARNMGLQFATVGLEKFVVQVFTR